MTMETRNKHEPAPVLTRATDTFVDALSRYRMAASTDRILNAVLDLMQKDPHHFSARPCSTCQCVSAIAGRDFGCVLKAKEKVAP